MNEIKLFTGLDQIEQSPRNIKINFDAFSKINIRVKEIYNCEITGTVSKEKMVFHGNVVMSYLKDFKSQYADWDRVDWKDSNLRNSRFIQTSFDYGAFINCHIAGCVFDHCHYANVSITGTVFFETQFINCDLSHMVIENCNFYNCKFLNCTTSNKLFEQCLIIGCSFDETDIQLQTITENFGIEKKHLKNSKIRNAALDEKFRFLAYQDLLDLILIKNESIQNIFKFKVEYFLKPNIRLNGSILFDKAFDLNEWVPLCKARSTFLNSFKLFHDFIIIMFEQNNIPLYAIYKLRELTKTLSNLPVIQNDHEFYPSLIGYDISLSRILSQANKIVYDYEERNDKKISLLVNGPLDSIFYSRILEKFIEGDFRITKVIKQNSPNLLEIVAISSVIVQIVSLFVTTRVKVELTDKLLKKITKTRQKSNSTFQPEISYNLINMENEKDDLLKLYFTGKQINRISINEHSSKEFGKVRRIIVDIHSKG